MILAGAGAIEASRQEINELNVFPVPDGDTGTNMSLTMAAAAADVRRCDAPEIGNVAHVVAQALLRGARGNSGVILSLLFRGFSRHIKEYCTISGAEFAHALQEGVDAAYSAVMKPAEGTVLTVSRVMADRAIAFLEEQTAIEAVLAEALIAGQEALAKTTSQNPVLQKAGVVDAGAKGYLIIMDAMLGSLQGRTALPVPTSEGAPEREKADFTEYAAEDIRFAYCTEFIIKRRRTKKDPIKLRAFLGALGDSLVFVDDESLIKVHVHTNHPGRALEEALAYGDLTSVKVDNMREQHTEKVIHSGTAGDKASVSERPYGFVSVCAGEGIAHVFRDLGVDNLVEGGQTMNPSTQDILFQINQTPAELVFVLPNNKNIIMAAQQCIPLTNKKVVVLPSTSVPQGIAALLAFDSSLEPDQMREAMLQAMSGIVSGSVTSAARQSVFDGMEIAEGDYLALLDGQLLCTGKDEQSVLTRLAEAISKSSPSYITLFYGDHLTEQTARTCAALFEQACPAAEVTLLSGGQPVYSYLISAE